LSLIENEQKIIKSLIMKFEKTYYLLLFICFLLVWGCNQYENKNIETLSGERINYQVVDNFLKSQMDSFKILGLSIAIINNAEIVYHRTLGYANIDSLSIVTERSLFEAGSLSKPLFAYFALKLYEKGVFDLDTPLYKYLPYPDIEYDERYKSITARMVLSHTTGFPNWRVFNPNGKLDIKCTPGTKFYYSGEAYLYLSKVIAHLTNRTLRDLDDYFQEIVSKEIGLKNSYFSTNDYLVKHKVKGHIDGKPVDEPFYYDMENFGAAGNLHSEAIDYSNFLITLMNNKGLRKESYNEMFKEHIKVPATEYDYLPHPDKLAWGLGFGIKNLQFGKMYFHEGLNHGFQSYFMIDEENKRGYVFFTNCQNADEFMCNLEIFLTKGNNKTAK